MLYAPLVIGFASGHPSGRSAVALVLSVTAAFLAQAAARAMPRRESGGRLRHQLWCGAYCALAAAGGSVLVFRFGFRQLALLAGIATLAFAVDQVLFGRHSRRSGRRALREVLAAATFSLTAPAAALVANGRLHPHAWSLWLLSTIFFTSSVLTVRTWIDGRVIAQRGQRTSPGGRTFVLFHIMLALLVTIGLVADRGATSAWWAAAFLPAVARAFHARVRAKSLHPALKTIGWMELGWTMLFTVMMVLIPVRHGAS